MSDSPDKLLRLREVETLTGMKSRTIYYAMEHNQFPKPVPLYPGARNIRWLQSEVMAHLKRCADDRDSKIARAAAAKAKAASRKSRGAR